ncbi:AEC family transporter [Vibrio sp. PNB22_3_1]
MELLLLTGWMAVGYVLSLRFDRFVRKPMALAHGAIYGFFVPVLLFTQAYQLAQVPQDGYLALTAILASFLLVYMLLVLYFITRYGEYFPSALVKSLGGSLTGTIMVMMPVAFIYLGELGRWLLLSVILFNGLIVRPLVRLTLNLHGERTTFSIKKWLAEPALIAVVVGFTFAGVGVKIDHFVVERLLFIGWFALPGVLLIAGSRICGMSLMEYDKQGIRILVLTKLLILPLCAGVISHFALNLDIEVTRVVVLMMSAPASTGAYFLASRAKVAKGVMSSVVVLTTAISLVTMTLWYQLFAYFL